MKQIQINEKKLNKIKKEHLNYCKKMVRNFGLAQDLQDEDFKLLFIENPFDSNQKVKSTYSKYKNYDFREIYKKFRTPDANMRTQWCASKLIEAIGLTVCPYCGLQYFAIVPKERTNNDTENFKIAEAQLDHFKPKSSYKYLALNIYNLIPVCSNCNTIYKNQHTEEFLNPYFESLEQYIFFHLENRYLPNYLFNEDIEISIEKVKKDLPENLINRINNQLQILHIKDRYKFYQDIIKSLIYKKQILNRVYSNQLASFLNISNKELERMLIQQDIFSDNEPFLKFKIDIWNQLS